MDGPQGSTLQPKMTMIFGSPTILGTKELEKQVAAAERAVAKAEEKQYELTQRAEKTVPPGPTKPVSPSAGCACRPFSPHSRHISDFKGTYQEFLDYQERQKVYAKSGTPLPAHLPLDGVSVAGHHQRPAGPRYPQGCGHTGFTGTSLFLSRERGVGGVLLTNRLTSPGREAKNVDPCRIAFHEAILAADEEGWL